MTTEKQKIIDALLEEVKMQPATLLKLKLEIDDGGYYYELDPTRDITPYECMLLFKLVMVAMNTDTDIAITKRYIKLNNLRRHFTKTNDIVEEAEYDDDEEYDD
jgi:hypothetical protein